MAREIAIGDIHGMADELKRVLSEVLPLDKDDRLIFLGDYFDRGSDSTAVFHRLEALKQEYGDQVILIRGNHDQMLMDFMASGDSGLWFDNGGRATVSSFFGDSNSLDQLAEWIAANTVYRYETERAIYVHGGLYHNDVTRDDEMIWLREEIFEGRYPKLVVVGHTIVWRCFVGTSAPLYIDKFNLVMMDNGAFKGRSLAYFDIATVEGVANA